MVYKRTFSNPVLILGGHLGGLMAAKNFGKQGIDVYIVSKSKKTVALYSKYCSRTFFIPGPWSCRTLRGILQKMGGMTSKRLVVYPLSDIDTLNLSKIKDDLRDDYFLMVGEQTATELLINKRKFYQVLEKNKIEHPVTHYPQNADDARQIGAHMKYPIFIKPIITEEFLRLFNQQKGFVANSARELIKYYHLATSHNIEVMFQEIIPGPPTSSFQLEGVYNKNSSPIGFFARQRLRIWPLGFGNTTLCVSIPLTEFSHEIRELNSFIKRINHTGLMSAEYKKDDRDGKLKILEINARIWLHFWLSTTCGFDILTASYLDAIGEKTRYFPEYAVGIKSLYLANDMKASLQMFKHGNLKLSDWASSLRGKKQIALFDKADLNPFLITYSNLATSPFRAPLNFIQKELMKSK